MGQISLSLPQTGLPNSTEDVKVTNDLTLIQNVINGNLDGTNVSAALAQSAAVNQAGQTVKGATNIAASESRSNVAYGTLPTPDQVTGIVLPTNGLMVVWYQAAWQESVIGAASAAIFVGANQQLVAVTATSGPSTASAIAGIGSLYPANTSAPLATYWAGLRSNNAQGSGSSSWAGDATTGQSIGAGGVAFGGPCYIFAAAGTYTVSVQFKSSSGSVTASGRKLWVLALSFA